MDELEYTPYMRVAIERNFFRDGVDVYLIDKPPGGPKRIITRLYYEELEEAVTFARQPLMTMTNAYAQHLIDELYRMGFRPTDAGESVGELAATKRHLDDMQRISKRLFEELLRKE